MEAPEYPRQHARVPYHISGVRIQVFWPLNLFVKGVWNSPLSFLEFLDNSAVCRVWLAPKMRRNSSNNYGGAAESDVGFLTEFRDKPPINWYNNLSGSL
jgi:hypothetical protein